MSAIRWIIAITLMPFAILYDVLDTSPPDPYWLKSHVTCMSRLIRYARGKSNG